MGLVSWLLTFLAMLFTTCFAAVGAFALAWNVSNIKYRKELHGVTGRYEAELKSAQGLGDAEEAGGGGGRTAITAMYESFTLGWLNLLVQHLWLPVLEKLVSTIAAEKLQAIFNELLRKNSKGIWKLIDSIAVEEVTFGLAPPQFQYCTAKYDPSRSHLLLSMNMHYHSSGFQAVLTPRIQLMGRPVAVRLEVMQLHMSGKLNLGLHLSREPPGIKRLDYSFASPPTFDLQASPVGYLNFHGELPGIVNALRTMLLKTINRRIVEPNRRHVDLQRIYQNKYVQRVGGPGGCLRVCVIGGRNLLRAAAQPNSAAAGAAAPSSSSAPAATIAAAAAAATTAASGSSSNIPTTGAAAAAALPSQPGGTPAGAQPAASPPPTSDCDSYVELRFGREVFRTPIAHQTADPIYNWQFDLRLPADLGVPQQPAAGGGGGSNSGGVLLHFRVLDACTLGEPSLLSSAWLDVNSLGLQPNGAMKPKLLELTSSGAGGGPRGTLSLQIMWLKAQPKKVSPFHQGNPRSAVAATTTATAAAPAAAPSATAAGAAGVASSATAPSAAAAAATSCITSPSYPPQQHTAATMAATTTGPSLLPRHVQAGTEAYVGSGGGGGGAGPWVGTLPRGATFMRSSDVMDAVLRRLHDATGSAPIPIPGTAAVAAAAGGGGDDGAGGAYSCTEGKSLAATPLIRSPRVSREGSSAPPTWQTRTASLAGWGGRSKRLSVDVGPPPPSAPVSELTLAAEETSAASHRASPSPISGTIELPTTPRPARDGAAAAAADGADAATATSPGVPTPPQKAPRRVFTRGSGSGRKAPGKSRSPWMLGLGSWRPNRTAGGPAAAATRDPDGRADESPVAHTSNGNAPPEPTFAIASAAGSPSPAAQRPVWPISDELTAAAMAAAAAGGNQRPAAAASDPATPSSPTPTPTQASFAEPQPGRREQQQGVSYKYDTDDGSRAAPAPGTSMGSGGVTAADVDVSRAPAATCTDAAARCRTSDSAALPSVGALASGYASSSQQPQPQPTSLARPQSLNSPARDIFRRRISDAPWAPALGSGASTGTGPGTEAASDGGGSSGALPKLRGSSLGPAPLQVPLRTSRTTSLQSPSSYGILSDATPGRDAAAAGGGALGGDAAAGGDTRLSAVASCSPQATAQGRPIHARTGSGSIHGNTSRMSHGGSPQCPMYLGSEGVSAAGAGAPLSGSPSGGGGDGGGGGGGGALGPGPGPGLGGMAGAGQSGSRPASLQSLAQVVRMQRMLQSEQQAKAELREMLQEVCHKYDTLVRIRHLENQRALIEGARFVLHLPREMRRVVVWYNEPAGLLHVDPDIWLAGSDRGPSPAGPQPWPRSFGPQEVERVERGSGSFRNPSAMDRIVAAITKGLTWPPTSLDSNKCFSLLLEGGRELHLQLPPTGNGRSRDEWVNAVQDLVLRFSPPSALEDRTTAVKLPASAAASAGSGAAGGVAATHVIASSGGGAVPDGRAAG